MSAEPISERVARHVAAFNDSARSDEWAGFARRFTPDATMRFAGVPVGPFTGREAIAAAYAAQPPTGTLINYPECVLRRRRRSVVRLGQQ